MSKTDLKAIVWQEDNWFIAKAFGLEVVSQGKTKKEAISNLQEAIDLYFEDENIILTDYLIPNNPELTALYA